MPENRAIPHVDEKPGSMTSENAAPDITASNEPMPPDQVSAGDRVSAPSTAAAVAVGAMLRAAREKQGLSAGDVATKLRMGLKQVTALENSDYAQLPTGTFLRGFVRNFAKVVSLNADEVLALLEKTHVAAAPVKASPVVVPSQQNIKVPVPGGETSSPKLRILALIVGPLLLIFATWYWWEYVLPYRSEGGRVKASPSQSIAIPQPVAVLETPVVAPAVTDTNTSAISLPTAMPAAPSKQAAEAPAVVPSVKPVEIARARTPAPVAPPATSKSETADANAKSAKNSAQAAITAATPSAGSTTLGFTFTGESWVRVTDASGKTILSRLFKAGEAEEVAGRAPFSVLIGNAKATRMALNGQEFAIGSYINPNGATARMTVK